MMMNAYDSLYIDDFQKNLGEAVSYFVHDFHHLASDFFDWMINCKIAEQIESGNPKYIAGMSGVELAQTVIRETVFGVELPVHTSIIKDEYYWAGWAMAYYQWYRAISFEDMYKLGLGVDLVIEKYVLHEADISKFVEVADEIIENNRKNKRLMAYYRQLSGMTQKQLSEQSGVPLRMIQLYEQGQNDISKANVTYVIAMAKCLNCKPQDLL